MCDFTISICRLAAVRDLVSGKQLMTVLLKLFSYCVKVKSNRQQLIRTEMNTISIMLGALNLVCHSFFFMESPNLQELLIASQIATKIP